MVVPPLLRCGCGARGVLLAPADGGSALVAVLPFRLGWGAVGGAVGVVGFGQLQPAGVVAKLGDLLGEPALRVDLVQIEGPGLLPGLPERLADLTPAVALLAGVADRLPAPAGQVIYQLAVGRQRLQGSWPLGPLGVALKPRKRVLVALLAGLLERQAHGVGHRPGIPGLQRSGERMRWQLPPLLVGAGLGVGGV